MKIYSFSLLVALCFSWQAIAKNCILHPPQDWAIAMPKDGSPFVQIGFIGKGAKEFRPSINLAIEEVNLSLKEYVKVVKELHTANRSGQWRDLGPFSMTCGPAKLIEMTQSSPWGDVKLLQAITIQNKQAYIVTAAVLKEEFAQFQEPILQAFKSLQIADTIPEFISDPAEQKVVSHLYQSLEKKENQTSNVETLKRKIHENTTLGLHWQFLALQEIEKKISSSADNKP